LGPGEIGALRHGLERWVFFLVGDATFVACGDGRLRIDTFVADLSELCIDEDIVP